MVLDNFLKYETVQIVRIRNVRVTLIYYFALLVILSYIVAYGLVWKKGYQATGQVTGSADIKVKGCGYVNQTLPWNGPSTDPCNDDSCVHVYDSYDLILPPMESNAVFVTTNMWVTKNQARGVCQQYSTDNTCTPDADGDGGSTCEALTYVTNGRQTGLPGSCRTNYTDPNQKWPEIVPKGSYCDVYAWCPTELELTNQTLTHNFSIEGVREFTVFVRMNVNYPKWGYTVDNSNGATSPTFASSGSPNPNLWTLEEMVTQTGWQWQNIKNQGITIGMNAKWDCDFDSSLTSCTPEVQFVRLDNPLSHLSPGFNFRSVEYLHNSERQRQLTKHYGVRLLVVISGVGGKFDLVALLTALGAGIGLLSVATLIADFIATNLLQNRKIYRSAKFHDIRVEDQALMNFSLDGLEQNLKKKTERLLSNKDKREVLVKMQKEEMEREEKQKQQQQRQANDYQSSSSASHPAPTSSLVGDDHIYSDQYHDVLSHASSPEDDLPASWGKARY